MEDTRRKPSRIARIGSHLAALTFPDILKPHTHPTSTPSIGRKVSPSECSSPPKTSHPLNLIRTQAIEGRQERRQSGMRLSSLLSGQFQAGAHDPRERANGERGKPASRAGVEMPAVRCGGRDVLTSVGEGDKFGIIIIPRTAHARNAPRGAGRKEGRNRKPRLWALGRRLITVRWCCKPSEAMTSGDK